MEFLEDISQSSSHSVLRMITLPSCRSLSLKESNLSLGNVTVELLKFTKISKDININYLGLILWEHIEQTSFGSILNQMNMGYDLIYLSSLFEKKSFC